MLTFSREAELFEEVNRSTCSSDVFLLGAASGATVLEKISLKYENSVEYCAERYIENKRKKIADPRPRNGRSNLPKYFSFNFLVFNAF